MKNNKTFSLMGSRDTHLRRKTTSGKKEGEEERDLKYSKKN